MPLLNDSIQKQLKDTFQALTRPVRLVLFTRLSANAEDCGMCADTQQLVEEVAALSDKITLDVRDFDADPAAVAQYQVDKVPALVVLGGEAQTDYRIRLYGIPSGYEFGTLVEDILMVSAGMPGLSEKTLAEVAKLEKPVRIQVFTTPT